MRFLSLLLLVILLTGCRRWFHKECRSSYPVNSGEIVYGLAHYCLAMNPEDKGDTLAITRSGQWDTLWNYFKDKYKGDCPKPNIDFTKNSVLSFYTTHTPHDKILRNVTFDHLKKEVVFTITAFQCKNGPVHKVLAIGYNYVVINKMPSGYKVRTEFLKRKR